MKSKIFFFSFVLVLLISVTAGLCLDEIDGYNTFSFTGEILEVNSDNGYIAVTELPDYSYFSNDVEKIMTFQITSKTKLFQDADSIDLDDITSGQQATVRYTTDDKGNLEALSITVDG